MVRHKKPGLRLRSLFLWHRYLGLTAAFFVAALAVSGVLINNGDALRLDQRHVQANWLLDWYGIASPAPADGYPVASHWLTQVGERVYFDTEEIDNAPVPLRGAVQVADKLAVATGDQLLLLTPQGAVIDRMSSLEGLPVGVQRVGTAAGHLLLHTPQGDYRTDEQFLTWQAVTAQGVRWATALTLPENLRRALITQYRGAGVSWERVLLDLHSGRLFGKAGVMVVNIAAVLMVLLAFTGVWHFFQRKRR